jgi:hypothetical protein
MLPEHVHRASRIPARINACINISSPQRNVEAREKVSELEEKVLLAKEAHAAEVQDLQEERRELFKAADEAQQQMKQVWPLALPSVNSPCIYSCSYTGIRQRLASPARLFGFGGPLATRQILLHSAPFTVAYLLQAKENVWREQLVNQSHQLKVQADL